MQHIFLVYQNRNAYILQANSKAIKTQGKLLLIGAIRQGNLASPIIILKQVIIDLSGISSKQLQRQSLQTLMQEMKHAIINI